MPPRFSSNRGVPRRGHSSRGDHPGGASRGSQLGGPSSNTPSDAPGSPSSAATPDSETPSQNPQSPAHPSARGHPYGNRGRGAGRGDVPDRGQFAARNRGRGRGRGGAPGTPSGIETTPATPTTSTSETASNTASFPPDPQSAIRGQSFRGRGGHRGAARGNPSDFSSSAFRGRPYRGGRGGQGGGFVSGFSSDTTGTPSGIPGKSYCSTKFLPAPYI